ncbi:MAG: hypothetical protein P4L62_03020 [Candidatus Pacebacteria bacterium]|nr:hypothetical protein [Candidatus Paceibacterota bacterium]MDR3583304.1 hypothetical protein [Candidatus Paceibacterota bacterium]
MTNKTDNLEAMTRCGVCRSKFGKEDIFLISDDPAKTIFHTTCPGCRTAVLVLLSNGQNGLLGMEMITDLDREEAKEKLNTRAITADEVIGVYKALK